MDGLNPTGDTVPQIISLRLPRGLWEQMRQEVSRLAPEEACGLLGGRGRPAGGPIEPSAPPAKAIAAEASHIWPVENMLHSPVRYQLNPLQQLAAMEAMDQLGLALVAIYHSHPRGPDHPSATDIAEAYYPETVYLIWSGSQGVWQCRGFTIQAGVVRPVELEIDGQEV